MRRTGVWWMCWWIAMAVPGDAADDRERRVKVVTGIPGLAAFWDFVERDASDGRFRAHQPKGSRWDFRLDAVNYVRDYWGTGRAAKYADFPMAGRGPFGEAIRMRVETDPDFRPLLMVPRERLHGSGLDVKGPARSVSMVVWMKRESGNHAIAGIWHEGTDHATAQGTAARVERGQRQYALFAGLAANAGASAAHVSENGASSFGDRYARNLSVTPKVIPNDGAWHTVGMVFDNARNTVTSYLDGRAEDYWIENPAKHPFFQWVERGWRNGEYQPPEKKARAVKVIEQSAERRVEERQYEFTRVRITRENGAAQERRELVALRVNPFWFAHDLYAPAGEKTGGPFTIGRVIHMGRNAGGDGEIGGVAVYERALSRAQMERLARVAARGEIARP